MTPRKSTIRFRIRFPVDRIVEWAKRYSYQTDVEVEAIAPRVRDRGHLTKDELIQTVRWKTPRSVHLATENPEDYVEAVTKTALEATNERMRIEILTLLRGVSWPMASVILHFFATDRYPILDFRALWSLRVDQVPSYDFALWWHYTEYCRSVAEESGASMRTVDRALWQYSKQHQRGAVSAG